MSIILVNGINTHGAGNVDLVGERLRARGHQVVDVYLPKRRTLSARWGAGEDAITIAKHSEEGDVLIAHSFGCLRAARAMRLREYAAAFLIAPAMSKRWLFRNPGRVWCYYSPSDWVVRLGALAVLHPFGRAGVQGFEQPGVRNVRCESDHDDYFAGLLLEKIVRDVHRFVDDGIDY